MDGASEITTRENSEQSRARRLMHVGLTVELAISVVPDAREWQTASSAGVEARVRRRGASVLDVR